MCVDELLEVSMHKILVPGGCGYLGSTLVSYLLSLPDTFVTVVDGLMFNQEIILSNFLGHPRFRFEWASVLDTGLMTGLVKEANTVIPLAALVGAPLCDQAPEMARRVNQDFIQWLVKELSPNQRVLFPMTNSGYGTTDGTPCTEETPLNPISLYARTKGEAEKAVLDHPNSVSLRLATVFGCSPRQRFDLLVNDFASRLAHQERLTIYEPHAMRNYVHVRDVARAFAFFLQAEQHTGVFNLGLPEANLTKAELAEAICELLSLDPLRHIAIGDGEDKDKRNYLVSNDKVLSVGFSFHHYLVDGIREVAQYSLTLTPPARKRMRNA